MDTALLMLRNPKIRRVFNEITIEDAEKISAAVGVDINKIDQLIQILRDWLKSQPHLPKDMEDEVLIRRLGYCKGSLQRAKDSIDMYYTLRNLIPDILRNRDPKAEWFRIQSSLGAIVPMPRLTEDYKRVIIFRCLKNDPNVFNAVEQAKALFMVSDLRYKYDLALADIYVVDMHGVTPAIVAKFTPPLLRKAELICAKAMNVRIAGIHLVNAPAYIDAFVSLLKRIITKQKIRERIHVHSKGMDTLHEFIDRKILPEEYGGYAGPIQKHWDTWKQFVIEHRDWFVNQDNKKANESKRPVASKCGSDFFGFEGSFRQLALD